MYVYMTKLLYAYTCTNLPVNVIIRLPHPRSRIYMCRESSESVM